MTVAQLREILQNAEPTDQVLLYDALEVEFIEVTQAANYPEEKVVRLW